jgi:hypothetical protein
MFFGLLPADQKPSHAIPVERSKTNQRRSLVLLRLRECDAPVQGLLARKRIKLRGLRLLAEHDKPFGHPREHQPRT